MYIDILMCMCLIDILMYMCVYIDVYVCVSGPYGERDEQQVFIQRVVPDSDKLYVRLSSNGKRFVCFFLSMCVLF